MCARNPFVENLEEKSESKSNYSNIKLLDNPFARWGRK
jgi:hypothetical protein